MWFESWAGLGRLLVVGPLAYLALIVILRGMGKRTLSKLNAFDFVVTLALGSTFATTLLSKQVALAEGVLAFALLAGLQYAMTWLSVRSARVRDLIASEPALLVHDGAFLPGALRRERVTRDEVFSALRAGGYSDIAQASAVVLETDGSISVIGRDREPGNALAGVRLGA
jgi:uncharacterized membrane protein YcaP (DUF421 family)